jgi:magnesium transporter
MNDNTGITSRKAGMVPGSLIHIGRKLTDNSRISIIDYDKENYQEKLIENIEDCFYLRDSSTVSWINIDGIHDVDIIEKLGNRFGLHPLVLEDIMHADQRPKMEDFDSYIYLVLKMFRYDETESEIKAEQISIVLGEGYVISFQEMQGDTFDPVRERLRNSKGRIRSKKADYLAYALLDSIVDNYFIILDKIAESIEEIEEELVSDPDASTLQKIHTLKKEMIYLRKSIWPLRDLVNNLERTESQLIDDSTSVFLRDVYDHAIRVADMIETYRDVLSGMMDVYLSSISNKMNEVMKTLTIIATIFIPLTFIAGIYGMNFENMPELGWKWGYSLAWIIMLSMSAVMIVYFRKKKWL